jgi:hypothetical protein
MRSQIFFSPLKTLLCSGAVVLALSAVLLPLQAQTPAPAITSNLLPNGDFSAATTDPTWPDDWGKAKAKGVTWETENGKHFLRLTAQEPNKLLMAYHEVVIPAGVTKLTITIHYRTSNIAVGSENWMDARAIFHFLDDNRKPVSPDPHLMDFSADATVWTEATETVPVPPGATRLVLMPSLFRVAAGTLDLADISVTPAP